MITTGLQHHHGINVDLVEQTPDDQHSRQNVQSLRLPDLAFMSGLGGPLDIVDQHGPPKTQQQVCPDRENTLMTKVIMGLLDESISTLDGNDQLVTSMQFPTVQGSIEEKKMHGGINKEGELCICRVGRASAEIKEIMDPVNLGVFGKSLQ